MSTLFQLSRKARLLTGILHHLEWDQETYMPLGAVAIRGDQNALIALLIHEIKTSDGYQKALKEAAEGPLNEEDKAALREWNRDFRIDTALPAAFVEKFAQTTSQAMSIWKRAREHHDFPAFVPILEEIIQLNRQKADYIGYKEHPYDALLDLYEPGMTSLKGDALFKEIKAFIIPRLKNLPEADNSCLQGAFDFDKQLGFGRKLLHDMGYNFEHGRLDLSTHPFSSSPHPTDSRVTTRLTIPNIMSNIAVCLHEGGHSLYEMGLPIERYGSPLGDAVSLGIHESQSRLWETRIGLTRPFWEYYYPELQKAFPEFQKTPFDTFFKAIHQIKPTFIRVEADEVTYPLHVILRFELEKALIEGSLKVADLPHAWNEKMQTYLGITPRNSKEGCLQDIHWAMGAFGYFPTYALGNIYAAHLFEGIQTTHPDWETRLKKGDLHFIRDWLSEKIYRFGRRYPPLELLEKATGKPLSVQPYLVHLETQLNRI